MLSEACAPDHPAHEWAAARYARTTETVVEALREAQQRDLLRPDGDLQLVAVTLLSTMDGLQLRDSLTPYVVPIDVAFARVAGQMLSDLAFDSPRAADLIATWRRRHESNQR